MDSSRLLKIGLSTHYLHTTLTSPPKRPVALPSAGERRRLGAVPQCGLAAEAAADAITSARQARVPIRIRVVRPTAPTLRSGNVPKNNGFIAYCAHSCR